MFSIFCLLSLNVMFVEGFDRILTESEDAEDQVHVSISQDVKT